MIYERLVHSMSVPGAERVAQLILRDEEAIQLAHEMAPGMGLSAVDVYDGILAGDAAFMGRKLLVHD